ncbi:MAG: hypothetical protein ACK5P8_02290, partial [Phycisphaerae bacterium]
INNNAPTQCGGGGGNDIFYSYTAGVTGQTSLSFCGSSYDTVVQVLDACSGAVLACNDDSCGLQSEVAFLTTAATSYIIQVDGFGVGSGAGSFTITEVPAVVPSNDSCATATVAIAGSNPLNNTFATSDGLVASCAVGGAGLRDTDWFEFTITNTSDIRFTGRAQFTAQLALLNNQCGAGLAVLAEGAEQLAGCSNISLTANALPAGTYRLFVGMAAAQPDTVCGSGANDYWFRFESNDTGTCDIDFNNNCVFPEDQDVVDFFNVLAGADCGSCDSIDFNRDQVFPDDQDVIDFFNVLAGAPCPY